jgi:septal ring factor EnvC (AmiA/AmiB activator)
MKLLPAHANIRAAMRALLLLLLCITPLCQAADGLRERQQELQSLKIQIQSISKQVAQDRQEKDSLGQDIEHIEKRLSSLRQALNTISRDLIQAEGQSKKLQVEQTQLQAELQSQHHRLQAQIRAAYIVGRQAQTRMLLSQDDPNRLARLQTYLRYFQEQHATQIQSFEATLLALNTKGAEIQHALDTLQVAKTGQAQALLAIETQRASRRQAMNTLEQRLRQDGASLQQLRARQAQMETLIETLSKAVQQHHLPALSENFARNKGKLVRPLDGPRLARFKQRKPDGNSRWAGLWLGAKSGTPVLAIAAARVVYVGWMHHFGLMVVLDHGHGYFSLYGHNRSALKALGDEVQAGEAIAEAGDTGGHSASGVYLEIRKGRDPQDPERWLSPAAK